MTEAVDKDPADSGLLPIVPMRNLVLFPGGIHPVSVSRAASVAAAQAALREGGRLGLLLQKSPETNDPDPTDLYGIGTVVSILRYVTGTDESHHLVCHGETRFRVKRYEEGRPYLYARIEVLPDPDVSDDEVEARALVLKQQAAKAIQLLPMVPSELNNAVQSIESPGALCDLVAAFLDIPAAEKQELLETLDVRARLDVVVGRMSKRLEIIELSRRIEEQTRASIDKRQREVVLREQLKTIQQELGEGGDNSAEYDAIEKSILDAGMPEETVRHALKELGRLRRMPDASGEYSMLRTYLDWLIELPWSTLDAESIDIMRAREILDEDHHGLEKIKTRIVEYLAVRKLNPEGRSPILCFVGPPGVGKTSLGQSIARSIGVHFVRASLGGVHDEAEIRGHRRTYIGALPGKIVQAIRKAGSRNPVFMLDEIDKLGSGVHGDPSSALLEALDPEQNATFQDNYLGVPFDLSKVLFIATANRLDTIAPPLLDRMEVIELSGYTAEEKLEIAKRYLVRRQLEANGLKPEQVCLDDAALDIIVRHYTREAGCRNLEKQIGAVLRNAAVTFAAGEATELTLGVDDVRRILGAPQYEDEVALRTNQPGVSTGLAWTPVGGDILFIESIRVPGDGRLILTGQLGDIMKESAQAALSLVKNRYGPSLVGEQSLSRNDVHVHVPAGAIPKDGPSAGVAIFLSLASLVTNRPVRPDVAMTGEISLRGQVLPVGGIKEKVVAAARAGIRTVMLPKRNRKNFDDIPESARNTLEFVWLETVDEAVEIALTPGSGESAAVNA